ncbi:MAG: class I SAM-dependent methyltransferase [Candidatus Margulisiibacteriota bacterium]
MSYNIIKGGKMDFKQIFDLLDNSVNMPAVHEGILNFVSADCPHKKIGEAYDKAIVIYDDYMEGKKWHLRLLRQVLLGIDDREIKECVIFARKFFDKIESGLVLEVPVGTGFFTFAEYLKYPDITFVAVDYSWGMLLEAKKRMEKLGVKNCILVRADVGKLPFKDQVFDGVLTLNGIHSFPEKEKAIQQMARVVKDKKPVYGTVCVRKERWLTDLMMELFYFPGKWFTRPALTKEELKNMLEKHALSIASTRLIKSNFVFEAVKS